MKQYYVLTQNPEFLSVLKFIKEHKLEFEAHINRTRFWISNKEVELMLLLKWGNNVGEVSPNEDLVTGYGYIEL
jgi:hypothetical protein